ncbi:FkbM family methyltransferase [Methylomonas sp. SURF-2]|uniref:FkbM family methyltransferase n=1 Tax=Methylomonas subterranea TaxID=2952225 RepID=A0ABT1THX8_9GAMM|nr:FkbM family methyltransferase [Methylomonas sp. SURF-2]MCQ8105066.1 FkbM family methyltransferase [Methylomonas sp. SURF-2]
MKHRLRRIKEILDHPSNRNDRISAFLRYLGWNVGRRLLDQADYVINIAPKARVILSNRENYATLAYTCGLYDFDEMSFLTDFLRPGDIFGDFGANVGVYSVLAGSLGATVLAAEPVPDTYARLQENLRLNCVEGQAVRCGLSHTAGKLGFTLALGGMNRVATPRDTETIEVDVLTADELVAQTGLSPLVVKIDVEGFELPLLRGSCALLPSVAAIIIELNGSGGLYGYSDDEVHAYLIAAGFSCFDYLPATRELNPRSDFQRQKFNSLYINLRMLDETRSRFSPGANLSNG